MQEKLRELTEKIYMEGISKGKEEAEKIVAEARNESEKIISQARSEAEAIISGAREDAGELVKNAEAELKMSFRDALNSLRQETEKMIAVKVVDEPVGETFSDNRLIARLIEMMAEKWAPGEGGGGTEVYISEEFKQEIEAFISQKARKALSSGITLIPVKSMERGFEIRPAGRDYKVSVTEKDFVNLIKEFIRPRLADLLFKK